MDQIDYHVHRCSGPQQRSTMMKISCLYSDSMLLSDTALCVTDEQFGIVHELSSEQVYDSMADHVQACDHFCVAQQQLFQSIRLMTISCRCQLMWK